VLDLLAEVAEDAPQCPESERTGEKRLAVVLGQVSDALAHLVRHGLSAP
jgi:hypothetical protein